MRQSPPIVYRNDKGSPINADENDANFRGLVAAIDASSEGAGKTYSVIRGNEKAAVNLDPDDYVEGGAFFEVRDAAALNLTDLTGLIAVFTFQQGATDVEGGAHQLVFVAGQAPRIRYGDRTDGWGAWSVLAGGADGGVATATRFGAVRLATAEDIENATPGPLAVTAETLAGFSLERFTAHIQSTFGPFVGDYKPFDGTAPHGDTWVEADGALYNSDEYPGGAAKWANGAGAFRVPDRRGKMFVGQSADFPFGSTGGSKEARLDISNLPKHRFKVAVEDGSSRPGLDLPEAANKFIKTRGTDGSNDNEYGLNGSPKEPDRGLTNEVGGDRPFSTMPPYWSGRWMVYIGRRVTPAAQPLTLAASPSSATDTGDTSSNTATVRSLIDLLPAGGKGEPFTVSIVGSTNSAFQAALSPSNGSVLRGSSVRATVSTTRSQGFTGDISGVVTFAVVDQSGNRSTVDVPVTHRYAGTALATNVAFGPVTQDGTNALKGDGIVTPRGGRAPYTVQWRYDSGYNFGQTNQGPNPVPASGTAHTVTFRSSTTTRPRELKGFYTVIVTDASGATVQGQYFLQHNYA